MVSVLLWLMSMIQIKQEGKGNQSVYGISILQFMKGFPGGSDVKNLPAMQETACSFCYIGSYLTKFSFIFINSECIQKVFWRGKKVIVDVNLDWDKTKDIQSQEYWQSQEIIKYKLSQVLCAKSMTGTEYCDWLFRAIETHNKSCKLHPTPKAHAT